MTSFSLRQVKLRPGEQYRDELEVELSAFDFGGQRYLPVPEKVRAAFEVTRANTGTVFSLAFAVRLHGPCYRCLGDAVLELQIHGREYQASSADDEQMTTPYVDGNMLDLSAWARDAIALALPDKILCRPDCAGLCGACGKNLNDEPHTHSETAADPRWAALEALRERR
ncbi:MAG: YceD family protein [Gaiellaceae bacterium]